jgi:hypothetical protein
MARSLPIPLTLLGYVWAAPNTLLGVTFLPLALLTGGGVQLRRGALELHGGLIRWLLERLPLVGGASGMTLGHVILGLDRPTLDYIRDHEQVHVRQYMRWGPAFLPAYIVCSLAMPLLGRRAYRDNPFEVEAYAIEQSPDSFPRPNRSRERK